MGFSLSDVHKLIHSASDRSMVRIVRTGINISEWLLVTEVSNFFSEDNSFLFKVVRL